MSEIEQVAWLGIALGAFGAAPLFYLWGWVDRAMGRTLPRWLFRADSEFVRDAHAALNTNHP